MIRTMTTERIFIIYTLVVGLAIGGVLVWVPQSRTIGLEPYFWVLIALALFEAVAYAWPGRTPGPLISMPARVIGFAIALALMYFIPVAAGIQVKNF
jgi:hypothetical protein